MFPRRSTTFIVAGLAAATLALTAGCTSHRPTVLHGSAVQPVSPTVPVSTTLPSAPSATTAAMGVDGVTLNGLVISTGTPTRLMSEYCCDTTNSMQAVTFTISIVNNTSVAYDVSAMQVEVHFGPNGTKGDPVYGDKVVNPTGTVTPGKVYTFPVGYQAPPADLTTMQVLIRPSYVGEMAEFDWRGKA